MSEEIGGQGLLVDPAPLRRLAFSIAYGMLGSVTEAEDIVQEAFVRFYGARQNGVLIESPNAYFSTVATRLAIDHFRSARVRREMYVGTWLPEPIVENQGSGALENAQLAESLSMALLTVMERLTPIERAVFLLREAFDYEYKEIAGIVEKSRENCRQIFARARRRLQSRNPRFEISATRRDEIARRFLDACREGSLDDFVDLLTQDVVFYGDGGGKAAAVSQPVHGRDRVSRLLNGLSAKGREIGVRWQAALVNGRPGAMVFDARNRLVSVFSLEIAGHGVASIRTVVNPEKLGHLGPVTDLTRLPERP